MPQMRPIGRNMRVLNNAQCQVNRISGNYFVAISHLLPVVDSNGEPMKEPQVPTWVDNWQRLGLVNTDFHARKPGKDSYAWVKKRPEYVELTRDSRFPNLKIDNGIIQVTDFGRQFARAVQQESTAT